MKKLILARIRRKTMTHAKNSLQVKEVFVLKKGKKQDIPFFLANIKAGFPSPADDFIDKKLDLNEHLIKHPSATFFVRVEGDSMKDAGIHSNDMLIVDRSLEVKNHSIVVAFLDGEFTVKRVQKRGKKLFLVPENADYSPIEVTEEMDFQVWGVVTHVIHSTE